MIVRRNDDKGGGRKKQMQRQKQKQNVAGATGARERKKADGSPGDQVGLGVFLEGRSLVVGFAWCLTVTTSRSPLLYFRLVRGAEGYAMEVQSAVQSSWGWRMDGGGSSAGDSADKRKS